jgi:hypothetical protein
MYGRVVFGLLRRLTFRRGFTDGTWWVGYLTTLYVLNVTNLIEFVDLERMVGEGPSVVACFKAASLHFCGATEENHKVVSAVTVGLPSV